MPAWVIFLASALAVAAAGTRLARDGDALAETTGLGGLWVGTILVAAATSLPELLTDLSAIRQGHAALAVGDLVGSSMANMAILALADLVTRRHRVPSAVAVDQALVATLAIGLTAVAALGPLLPTSWGWPSLVIAAGYLLGLRVIHRHRRRPPPGETGPSDRATRAAVGFALATLVILLAAPHLAASTAEVAAEAGISKGFAGMLLLALATSLPEASVSLASIRRGTHDLTVGSLLGSNCFNVAMLAPLDVVHGPGSILASAGTDVAAGALVAILLMAFVLLDVLDPTAERRIGRLEIGPALVLVTWVAGLVLIHRAGG